MTESFELKWGDRIAAIAAATAASATDELNELIAHANARLAA
jgi:hypothetical protein